MIPAILPLLLLAAAPVDTAWFEQTSSFEGSVGLGGGQDSNLDLAPDRSSAAFGSATMYAWADGGWSFETSPATRVYAGMRYDGFLCADASDLDRHVIGADASLTYELSEKLAAVLAPGVGYAFYGDPSRNAWRMGGRALIRLRPADWLSLRAGYGRAQSWAVDAVYSLGVDRVLTSAEARIARRSYVAAGYSLSLGDQVFYRAAPPVGPGAAHSNARASGRFASLEPYQAYAREHTLSLRWEQGLWRELYLTVSYDYTRGSSVEGPYVVNSWFAGTGYRF